MMAKDTQADSLANVYTDIRRSQSYERFSGLISELSSKLNHLRPSIQSKADFSAWLSSNLSRTNFIDVAEGERLYNDLEADQSDLHSTYSSFFDAVSRLSKKDLHVVVLPSITSPVAPNQEQQSDCLTTVLENANHDFDTAESEYESCMGGSILGLADWWCNWNFNSAVYDIGVGIQAGIAACSGSI